MVAAQGNPDTIEMLRKRVDPQGIRVERYAMEEMWLRNWGIFAGQSNFYIEGGRIWTALNDVPEHKVLYKVNLTRSACLRGAAKILNVRPRFRGVPQSPSIRHLNIAETSEKVFDHQRDSNDWDNLLLQNTITAMICGSGFYKAWFDPLKGEVQRFYELAPGAYQTSAGMDPNVRQAMDAAGKFDDKNLGDVRFDIASPFSIYHDWTSRDRAVEGCQYIAEKHFIDKAVIAERFGVDEDDLQSEDNTGGLLQYEEAVAFMSSNQGTAPFSWATPQDKRGKRCMYVELWERPSRKYKKGRRVVYAGKRILFDGDNPYIGDKTGIAHLPYVKQDWTPMPGRFWGSSLVEDLASPQRNLDDSRGCLLEFLRIFGRPATFVGSNSGIDPKTMTIDPGGVYTVNEISKGVTHAPVPQLPPDVTGVGAVCQSDLLSIASQSEVDGSKMPGQMRSGLAIRTMQEDRDVALSVSSMQAIRAARDCGRIGLTLGQLFYTQKRTLRYLGEDNQFEYRDFQGADLTNDIIVIGDPSIADTVNSKRAEMLDAVQVGALSPQTNPEDRELILAALHYNDSGVAINSKLKARKNEQMEIRAMMEDPTKYPKGYPVMEWEDHAQAVQVLIDFMYTSEFKAADPFTQSIITLHWKSHQQFLQQQQAQQLAMIQAAKGSPGQVGQASQAAPSA